MILKAFFTSSFLPSENLKLSFNCLSHSSSFFFSGTSFQLGIARFNLSLTKAPIALQNHPLNSFGSTIFPAGPTSVIILICFSIPSFPLWLGSRVCGCVLRSWSRGLNVYLCGCCLYSPFLYSVLSSEMSRTSTSSFLSFRRDLYIRQVKVLAEVTQPKL